MLPAEALEDFLSNFLAVTQDESSGKTQTVTKYMQQLVRGPVPRSGRAVPPPAPPGF